MFRTTSQIQDKLEQTRQDQVDAARRLMYLAETRTVHIARVQAVSKLP